MKPSVLIVEDDRPTRTALETALSDEGYQTATAPTAEAALKLVQQGGDFAAVVTDVVLGEGMSGVDLLRRLKVLTPDTVVVLVTGFGTVETAVEAIKIGAWDYFTKPVDLDRLINALSRGLRNQRLARENRLLKQQLKDRFSSSNIIGRSRSILRLLEDLERVAASDANVLLTGESGVGKDLFAAAIHQNSPRSDRPMVCVNCPALSESIIESELFGHEKGAFTGAMRVRVGRFEMAHKGTLFLDEIGELGAAVQAKLLRVLENRVVERVGGAESLDVDVRVVAATNRNVEKEVSEGRFRADLYYRLSVFRLHIPPLRERAEDIPLLVDHFLREYAERHHRDVKGVTPEAMKQLCAYAWPGNIRELRNLMERALVLTRRDVIGVDDLPALGTEPSVRKVVLPVGTTMDEAERQLIQASLDACQGNKARTARMLNMSLRTLYRRLESLDLVDGGSEE